MYLESHYSGSFTSIVNCIIKWLNDFWNKNGIYQFHVIHAAFIHRGEVEHARLCDESQKEFVTNGHHHQGFYSRINYLPYGASS